MSIISPIAPATAKSFAELNLHADILKGLKSKNFETPTDIQAQAIPQIMAGHDVIISAQTGAGKTLAFVLPLLERLMTPSAVVNGRGPRALILSPTRELANQITQAIKDVSSYTRASFGSLIGGVPYPVQERMLRAPLDILVATPGRLMDHMQKGRVDFSRIELLILDEADRMLDMGFVEDMDYVVSKLPKGRQTLLFSATLEGKVHQVSRRFLKDPITLKLTNAKQQHSSITQHVHRADNISHKRALLNHLLNCPTVWQAIVFTGTKRAADELADTLNAAGMECAALHGDMKQSKRMSTLDRMHRGKLRILVATDVAARGIDVKGISHVINFDLPAVAEDYIHRIGRTGRAGATGIAVSLIGPDDGAKLARIERLTGQRLTFEVIPGLEPKFRSAPQSAPKRRPGSSSGESVHKRGGFKFAPQDAGPKSFNKRPEQRSSSSRFQAAKPYRAKEAV